MPLLLPSCAYSRVRCSEPRISGQVAEGLTSAVIFRMLNDDAFPLLAYQPTQLVLRAAAVEVVNGDDVRWFGLSSDRRLQAHLVVSCWSRRACRVSRRGPLPREWRRPAGGRLGIRNFVVGQDANRSCRQRLLMFFKS